MPVAVATLCQPKLPAFGHPTIPPLPHLAIHIHAGVDQSGGVMGTPQDHRKCAEECFAMAQLSRDDSDKALWLTMAQSWVRLAEHVARGETCDQPIEESAEVSD
jgi:hypothetical protein